MFLKKFFTQILISLVLTLGLLAGVNLVFAQAWQEPGAAPPGGNLPGVIWNSQASGVQQNASFYVSGTGRIGQGGAFGNFTPDAVWMVSSPNAYFGNGVAGTMIGAGGGQNAGDIKTDGNLYVIGNTGIGTAAPSAKLQIVSNSEILRLSGWTGAPDSYYLGLTSIVGAGTVDYRFRTIDAAGGTRDVLFFDSSTGNVGIGTTVPAQNLDVRSTGATAYIRAGDSVQTSYTGLDLETNSGSGQFWKNGTGYAGYGGARSVNIYNSEDFPIAFYQGASERMRINSGGNVGIGVTPGASTRLQVAGMGLFTGGTYNPTDGTPAGVEIGFNTGSSYGFIQSVLTGVTWHNLAINPGGGNVGIGTASPGSKLDVLGNINSSGDVIGTRLCIGADCRNVWPGAGGGGDMTGVSAGTGITGGGLSGDVTVSLDTTYTDGRYVNVPGDTMTGSLVISGAGNDLTVADSGAFGGNAPDATWKVSSPNAYFGNGVAGTIIGAGGGQAAGAITTDGNVKIGNDLMVNTADSGVNPGMPWIRSSGAYLVVNSNTGALYLNQDVAQPIYMAQQTIKAQANGIYMNSNGEQRLQWGTSAEGFLATLVKFAGGSDIWMYSGDGATPAAILSSTGLMAGGDNQKDLGSPANSWRDVYVDRNLSVGAGGAFGGYTPDPNWRVTAPNGYFGDGGANQVLIGLGGNGFGNAGGINASGKITTSNDLYVGGGNIDVYPAIVGQNSVLGFNGNGTLSWVPLGDNFEFNKSVFFRGGLATTIGQTATFSGPVAVNGGYNLVVQGQVLGNTCALPGSTCTSGAPYTNANTISATNFCIGADCRNVWPAGGGGGDMTGVSAGTGLTGGGLSGDVILSLDAAHNDGSAFDSRFINTAGDTMTGLLTAAGAGISLGGVTRTTWPADGDITGVTAGSGLSGGGLTGGVTLTWSGNALTANSGLKGNGTAAIPLEIGAGDRINVIGDHVDFGGVAKAAASGLGGNGTSVTPLAVGAGTGIIVGASTISVDDNRYVNEAGDSIGGSITLTTGNVVASDGYICANSAAVASNCGTAPGTVYGDFAYVQFDVAELILSGQNLEPGEVVVIDPEVDEQVMRSYKTNDTAIAGVVSTDPGILGGHTLKAKAGTQTVELTLAGRIPVKVTDEGGPIKRGDLLTTSNTPGYAMKCADRAACVGAIVGKAMGELQSGKGTIVVLMSLQ